MELQQENSEGKATSAAAFAGTGLGVSGSTWAPKGFRDLALTWASEEFRDLGCEGLEFRIWGCRVYGLGLRV